MFSQYSHNFSTELANTDIALVKILNDDVIITNRRHHVKAYAVHRDHRTVPVEEFNF